MASLNHVTIYTDGACSGNPGPGAWAAVLIFGNIEKEISGFVENTTNNRMELQAAIEGLKALNQPCRVDLYSDSAYLVSAFKQNWLKNWQKNQWKNAAGQAVSNKDLWLELLRLADIHDITWHKVKGHADNKYNNRCDELAVNKIKSMRRDLGEEAENKATPSSASNKQTSSASKDRKLAKEGDNADLTAQIIEDESVFEGRLLKLHRYRVEYANGYSSQREVIRHPGGVAIVALNSDKEILMVEQFRTAAGKVILELPAGKISAEENPLETAKRELKEETGYSAKNWRKLSEFYVSPAYTDEIIHLYLARNLHAGKQNPDPGEFLKLSKLPWDEVLAACKSGEINDAKTLIGILLADNILQNE